MNSPSQASSTPGTSGQGGQRSARSSNSPHKAPGSDTKSSVTNISGTNTPNDGRQNATQTRPCATEYGIGARRINELEQELGRARAERDTLVQREANLLAECNAQTHTINDLSQERDQLSWQIQNNRQLRGEYHASRIRDLQRQVRVGDTERDGARGQRDALARELSEARGLVESLAVENDQLRQTSTKLEKERKELEGQVEASESKAAQLQASYGTIQDRYLEIIRSEKAAADDGQKNGNDQRRQPDAEAAPSSAKDAKRKPSSSKGPGVSGSQEGKLWPSPPKNVTSVFTNGLKRKEPMDGAREEADKARAAKDKQRRTRNLKSREKATANKPKKLPPWHQGMFGGPSINRPDPDEDASDSEKYQAMENFRGDNEREDYEDL